MNSIPIFVILFAIGSVQGVEKHTKQNGGNGNDSPIHHNQNAGTGNVGAGSTKVTRQIRVVAHQPPRGLKSLEENDTGNGVLSNRRVVETKNEPAAAGGGTVPAAAKTAAEVEADHQKQVEEYILLMHEKHKLEHEVEEAHEQTEDRREYEKKLQKAERKEKKEHAALQSEARVYMHRSGNVAEQIEAERKAELAKIEAKMAKYPPSVAEEAQREEQNKEEALENGLYSFSEPFEVDNGEFAHEPLKPHDDGRGAKNVATQAHQHAEELAKAHFGRTNWHFFNGDYVPVHEPLKPHDDGGGAKDVGTSAHKHVENPPIVSNAHDPVQQTEHDARLFQLADQFT